MRLAIVGVAGVLLAAQGWGAQVDGGSQPGGEPARQVQEDDYTSYDLLAPDTHRFRIGYDVTATAPGARYFFNVIRKGSAVSDVRVIDLASGAPAAFAIVSGADARAGGYVDADTDAQYIRVALVRPVPQDGGVRLRIEKTYEDPGSYGPEGSTLVFKRSLGIKRNRVVLPSGYEVMACNVPSQVRQEADGRIAISFMNANPGAVDLVVRARPLPRPARPPGSVHGQVPEPPRPPALERRTRTLAESASWEIPERARQDREIVYRLQPPETHAFDLYHDYTESREGVATYLNVVRTGSRVSRPSATNLDTGERLETELLRGREAVARAGIDPGEPLGADTEVVVVRFPPVTKGSSIRLRISETYTDPGRYGLVGDTLVWHRAFGRPRNALVLPAGYYVVGSSIPGTVTLEDDGRVRLDFWNGRPDEIDVLVRALRR